MNWGEVWAGRHFGGVAQFRPVGSHRKRQVEDRPKLRESNGRAKRRCTTSDLKCIISRDSHQGGYQESAEIKAVGILSELLWSLTWKEKSAQ